MSGLNFIVLTGRFAAGKDTQGALLVRRLGETSEVISTGDIYRSAKLGTGKYGHYHHLIVPYIEDIDIHGKLLPDEIMTNIVQEVILEEIRKGKETFIFTGFPRTLGQLDYFDRMLAGFKEGFTVNSVFVEYAITDELTRERSHRRRVEIEERGERPRPEDSDSGITNRIATYYQNIEPMIERLKEEDRLITIDAGRSVESIEIETASVISKERM